MIDGFDNKFIHARIRLKLYQMKKYQAQGTIATKTKMKPVTVTNSESISGNKFLHEFRIQNSVHLAHFKILFSLIVTLA